MTLFPKLAVSQMVYNILTTMIYMVVVEMSPILSIIFLEVRPILFYAEINNEEGFFLLWNSKDRCREKLNSELAEKM